ncbi:MAG: RHS repeat-associated core domain-containing protein [Candidatus Binataceae bacterium]|nr:RHS repeat-associated core domain-containing protein [Candidatus Binataceae bacterium]
MALPANVAGGSSTAYNAGNEQTKFNGASLSYDLNGNLSSGGSKTYTWDARDHLKTISGAVTASFVYDAFGRRMKKTISGTVTQFLYDGLNPVQELNSSNGVVANLLTGLNIDEYFSRTDTATSTFLSDALGSTVGLVGSAGSIATNYTYQPFGATTVGGSANGNSYEFTGRENDGTGLNFNRARYYNPTYQRFVSQDPIGFAGGDANMFVYATNSPLNFRDPRGTQVYPGPRIQQIQNDLENAPPGSAFTPYPPGEPAMSCAPPPPPPQACPGGATPPEQLDPIGIYTGLLGYGGFLAFGPWGAVGGAILGFGTGLWVNGQQMNNCP